VRPLLTLLCARSGAAAGEPVLRAAAAVELLHMATLVHDDVLDEATVRRHLATVNARWDNETSVLLGDYMFARAICLASDLENTYVHRALGEASRRMCEGELRQVGSRGQYDLSEADYLSIVAAKTAALCACCCRLGSHLGGATPELEEALAQYGHHLGIAFQIVDDVLDVRGSEAVTGKSLGTDLMKRKPTLPLIRLLSEASPEDHSELVDILGSSDDHRLERLKPWLLRSDAVGYAQQQAIVHVSRAKAQLDLVPPSPARESLRQLADFVVTRQE